MAWEIEIDPLAEKALSKLDRQQAQRILKFLYDRVSHLNNPRSIGKILKGPRFNNIWVYRIGDYRIFSNIRDKESRIFIIEIEDRKESYR